MIEVEFGELKNHDIFIDFYGKEYMKVSERHGFNSRINAILVDEIEGSIWIKRFYDNDKVEIRGE